MSKVGKYTYYKSSRKDKKLMTNIDEKTGGSTWVHFGSKKPLMEHYFDKTGLLDKKLNHGDKDRRKSYLARAKSIKDKNGKLTKDNPYSPNYHSIRILWDG